MVKEIDTSKLKCMFKNIKNMNDRKEIGLKIEQLRKLRGLTQLELSRLAGIDRANISKIESGKYNVGIDILNKIAEAMNVTLDFNENEKIQNLHLPVRWQGDMVPRSCE